MSRRAARPCLTDRAASGAIDFAGPEALMWKHGQRN